MKPYAIGMDVGGTKIAAGLVDRSGQILSRFTTHAHSEKQPQFVIQAIGQAFDTLLAQVKIPPQQIEAVGLGFAGTVNGPAGLVLISSNLPAWDHFPLRDVVAERVGVPVVLDNDTNICALGEHRFGAGRDSQNMGYVTFSTGYGLGVILNGQLYVGHTGTAGEIAHVVVEPGGPPCTCGKRGCLMAFASGIGLSRMAYEKIEAGAETLLRERQPANGERFTGRLIAEAAAENDPVANEILQVAGYYGGIGLSMIIQMFNPEIIVLGGGLLNVGDRLLAPMMTGMRENTQPELLDSAQIVPWQLGNDLGILGAASKVFAGVK
ncbi:MAG: ROK family protein [Anaerolineae bacterium]|nr:ROK family protein [Anaerolineae bacterium]